MKVISKLKDKIKLPAKPHKTEKAAEVPHRVRYEADPKSFVTQLSMILMAAAAVFRLIGCWGMWKDANYAVTQIALPVLCALMYILLVLLLGKRLIEATTLPVVVGAAFFIMASVTAGKWLAVLLTILYCLAAVVVYCGTIFGVIRTKWYLLPLFGLPFVYRVLVRDVAALRDTIHPVSFAAGMQEMSVLCILLSLLTLAIAMRKKQPKNRIDGDLPKMNAPKVTAPEDLPADSEPTVQINTELPGEQI